MRRRICGALISLGAVWTASATQIHWEKIVWQSYESAGRTIEHAGLMVEVRVDGASTPAIMQLDTGCDVNVLYAAPARQMGLSGVLLNGSAAGRRFEGERFTISRASSAWRRLLEWAAVRWSRLKERPIMLGHSGPRFSRNGL